MVNLYPQNANFNRGALKALENEWATALNEGKTVEVNIELKYGDHGVRPNAIRATYQIDGGRPINRDFENARGGVQ